MSSSVEFGVRQVFERIQARLQRYLEAQYHIRDADLIEERRRLLLEPKGIAQLPFVEVTPSYATVGGFRGLAIPAPIRDLLEELSTWKPSVGVYPPYQHQADALEAFFAPDPRDLVVATGTGSGKTETFLYSILGALALEAAERRTSFGLRGVRALLLYPMNALVSDQTARLRKLLGDERLARRFRDLGGRHPQFGMYTSRTPYPGTRSGAKDQRHLVKLIGYYEELASAASAAERREGDDSKVKENLEKATLVKELMRRGRWP
ncbi:MAG TPA: DEAD/DEAH box helicase, partial [Anaeromyxobacteraceae bacterium]|nr:DEAD/DEAH box helicase [Anaeromyxobacteraceae bacterium]